MYCRCHAYEAKIMDLPGVLDLLREAVDQKKKFSLTRFSHSEIACLSWQIDPKLALFMEQYRRYNGATAPLKELAEQIRESLQSTDVAGLISLYCRDNGRLWYKATQKSLHFANIWPNNICSVWSTHAMIHEKFFWDILKRRRVALVGRRAEEAIPYFKRFAVDVVKSVTLEGVGQVDPVCADLIKDPHWDIALVAAGIPATILTPRLADSAGRVVVDFGHALDMVIDGNEFNFRKLQRRWKKQRRL